jgi:cbb3-type cytochrome oxidase maturation protein
VDILYLLIPLSAVLVLLIVGIFGWALHRGQFDESACWWACASPPSWPGPN